MTMTTGKRPHRRLVSCTSGFRDLSASRDWVIMQTVPTSEPCAPITDEQVAGYERDGFVCLGGSFDLDWIEHMRAGIERAAAAPGPLAQVYTKPGEAGRSWGDHAVWERVPEFREFVFKSPAPTIAATLMRSDHV